jgi:hypothetical protein
MKTLHDDHNHSLLAVVEPGIQLVVEIMECPLTLLLGHDFFRIMGIVDHQVRPTESGALAAHRSRQHLPACGVLKHRLLVLIRDEFDAGAPKRLIPSR